MSEDNNYIFSKELRDSLSEFGDLTPKECLENPDFYDTLMSHCGMDEEEKKALCKKIGRPDLYVEKE